MRNTEKCYLKRPAQSKLVSYLFSIVIGLLAAPATASSTAISDSVRCAYAPNLSCTDIRTGETLWEKSHYSDPDKITIWKSQLYVSHSTNASSYDVFTGKLLWQVSSDSDAHYFYPVVSGENVYLTRTDGLLEKRKADSGKIVWSRILAEGWVYPPLIQQNKVISGGQNRIIWVLTDETGQTLDSFKLQQELVAPLFQIDHMFVASTFDGRLNAFTLSPKTGELKPGWQTLLGAPAFSYLSDSRYLVTADMGGTLSSLDPETGHLRWQKTVHRNALFWNVAYQQSLISLTESGSLTILDSESGQLQQQMQFDHRYIQAPIIQGARIALYDTTGSVEYLTPEILHGTPAPRTLTSIQRGILK